MVESTQHKKVVHNAHHGKQYDVYDKEGTVHSLLGKCVFCRFAAGKVPEVLLYEVMIFMNK